MVRKETGAACAIETCDDPATIGGLCQSHYGSTRPYRSGSRPPDGHLFDVLRERLNVFQETGGACTASNQPCEFRICRYHVDDDGFVPRQCSGVRTVVQDLREPCALKLAREGGMTLEDVGFAHGLTRERIRQIEAQALEKVRRGLERAGFSFDDVRECLGVVARL